MNGLFFWLAFAPVGLILLGLICLAGFAFIATFIFVTYRKRQTSEYVADLVERNRPDVIDAPEFPEALADALAEDLPPTHYTPRTPWRHS